jgi:hypothetical protein
MCYSIIDCDNTLTDMLIITHLLRIYLHVITTMLHILCLLST